MNEMFDPPSSTAPQDTHPYTPAAQRPIGSRRTTVAIMGITLLAGLVGGAWLMKSYGPSPEAPPATAAMQEANASDAPSPSGNTVPTRDGLPALAIPVAAEGNAELAYNRARIIELEQRIAEVTQQAQAAGGNASRAEGLLVSFAARRAIERGLDLGYIENELHQRFGGAMPRAVATIIDASKHPVTPDRLTERLHALEPQLRLTYQDNQGLWANAQRGLRELFVVRGVNATDVAPDQRLARAYRSLDIGRVDRAITEVEKLPGAASAQNWLVVARRYSEAQRALDLIEYAAIKDPRGATAPVAQAQTAQ